MLVKRMVRAVAMRVRCVREGSRVEMRSPIVFSGWRAR